MVTLIQIFFFGPKIVRCLTIHLLNVGVLLLHLDEMQVYHTLPPPPSTHYHPPSQTQSMDASQSLSNSLLRLTYTP